MAAEYTAAEARKAYYLAKDARREEERFYRIGLGPKPRRRPPCPGGRAYETGAALCEA